MKTVRTSGTSTTASPMTSSNDGAIDPKSKPSGTGCVECLASNGWWLHLRRCAECGHIGCCDTSPSQHATKHSEQSGHPVIASFEPGEQWFYDYRTEEFIEGPSLAAPHSHPLGQPVPGPADRVPPKLEESSARLERAVGKSHRCGSVGFSLMVAGENTITALPLIALSPRRNPEGQRNDA